MNRAVTILICLVLTGCVSHGQQEKTEARIDALEAEVSKLGNSPAATTPAPDPTSEEWSRTSCDLQAGHLLTLVDRYATAMEDALAGKQPAPEHLQSVLDEQFRRIQLVSITSGEFTDNCEHLYSEDEWSDIQIPVVIAILDWGERHDFCVRILQLDNPATDCKTNSGVGEGWGFNIEKYLD